MIQLLNDVDDPRDTSRTKYESKVILFARIISAIFLFDSMRKMTNGFYNKNRILNVSEILGVENLEQFPHYSTINDYLERLPSAELETIIQKMSMSLANMRAFKNGRYRGRYWQIIIDGVYLFPTDEENSEGALFKVHKDKDGNIVKVEYYYYALEAKILLSKEIVVSICTVFCKNEEGVSPYNEVEKGQEKKKQDCELKAFYRMEGELKKLFGKSGICLTADSLYACETVFEICKRNGWRYIIRFKEGSIKTIAEEFNKAVDEFNKTLNDKPHKYKQFTTGEGKYGFLNTVFYKGHYINMARFTEETDKSNYPFLFITNLPINRNNCAELIIRGRNRWSIENHGFNEQKNHGYALTHKFSLDYNAMQNHYLLIQIAHAISQIFENQISILTEFKIEIYDIHERIRNDMKYLRICEHEAVRKSTAA